MTPGPDRGALTLAPRSVRVVILDDQPLVRAGLCGVLARIAGVDVVGEADTVSEARRLLLEVGPHVLVTELGRGRDDGLAFVAWAREHRPDVRIVVLSRRPPEIYAERALRAGARAFVAKTEPVAAVVAAIRAVMAGRLVVPPEVAQHIMFASVTGLAGKVGVEALSDRELQVFELIGEGRSTREIATALHVSEKTVASHRGSIKDKLQLEGLGALVRRAVLWVEERGDAATGTDPG